MSPFPEQRSIRFRTELKKNVKKNNVECDSAGMTLYHHRHCRQVWSWAVSCVTYRKVLILCRLCQFIYIRFAPNLTLHRMWAEITWLLMFSLCVCVCVRECELEGVGGVTPCTSLNLETKAKLKFALASQKKNKVKSYYSVWSQWLPQRWCSAALRRIRRHYLHVWRVSSRQQLHSHV